jgi:uncharacterized membrane protein YhaH (DUF805 family)
VHMVLIWLTLGYVPTKSVRSEAPHPVAIIIWLAVGLPTGWALICLEIKRWHDRNKSWEWTFIKCIPVVGNIWALVECGFLNGTQGPNRFGPSPKGVGNDTVAKAFE